MTIKNAIHWFRRDLRLQDNASLSKLEAEKRAIVPVYIHDIKSEREWGGASKWWLHHSLVQLESSLAKRGLRLIVRKGDALTELKKLIKESDADTLQWNRLYDPDVMARDAKIKTELKTQNISVESFPGHLIFEPWEIQNLSKKPFQVYTPFWKKLSAQDIVKPLPKATRVFVVPKDWPASLSISDLKLLPTLGWDSEFKNHWQPGEMGAQKRFQEFLKSTVLTYKDDRNRPDKIGTSKLSPHLHFGEISPRTLWHETCARRESFKNTTERESAETFLKEVVWREFAHHLLYHFQDMPTVPLQKKFLKFRWSPKGDAVKKWQKGKTGYPIVDAGMRELWTTGFMHNRVRMIVASFLTKDLFVPWQEGEKWFWDTLVDADQANNAMGWQWVSGCGADAAPYFRVFNPVTQGEKFDPAGDYIKRWVPELSNLPEKWIHKPFEAPEDVLKNANVILGKTYPHPIVDHAICREEALKRFKEL